MKAFISIFFLSVLLIACKSDKSASYPTLDLLKYGFPIEIKAPEGAEVTESDLGVLKDVTVKSGDDYYVQVFSSDATELDPIKIKSDLLEEVKGGIYFSKIVEDNEIGFIFEKKIDSLINYDFRYVKVLADKEYVFQTGLFGKFSEDQVKTMYKSVQ